MSRADAYIDRVRRLPPAPTVANRLLGLFHDPNRDIERVVEVISLDPSLTGELLRRSNSAFFGASQPASDVSEAVSRLGFNEVYSLVLMLVSSRALTLMQPGGAIDPEQLWRHSVTTAVAASTLARWTREEEPVAFTAGLMHDLGKMVLAASEAATYGAVIRRAGGFGPALIEAEQSAFGVTHAGIGARLLARWGLPPAITQAVLYHAKPPPPPNQEGALALIVRLASELAHQLAGELPAAPPPTPAQAEILNRLDLAPDYLGAVVEQTQENLQRVKDLLRLRG